MILVVTCNLDVARADQPLAPTIPARVELPEPTPQAVAYHHSGNALWAIGRLWSLAIPLVVFASGFSARLGDWAWTLGRRRWIAIVLFGVAYFALAEALALPFTFYTSFIRQHEYGLSNQTLQSWLTDEAKALAVSLILTIPVLLVAYALIRAKPRTWWLWAAALGVPATAALVMVTPIWIDPLFNEFTPMRDKALEARILELAHRVGIDVDQVFEVDMSRKTNAVNAYVTGLAGTKRIVLWDTLLAKLEPDQVLVVMGHEMGHYVLNHVAFGVLIGSALGFAGLAAVAWLAQRALPRFANRSRVESLDDFASLPLLIALGIAVSWGLTPIGYAVSRHAEREADRFALELLQDNHAAATAFVALQRENLGYPRPAPWYVYLRGSHPSLGERVDFCNDYRPWETGAPLRYAQHWR